MKTITDNFIPGAVKTMRAIRDELNAEIKEMTFAEERAFLDKLLSQNARPSQSRTPSSSQQADIRS